MRAKARLWGGTGEMKGDNDGFIRINMNVQWNLSEERENTGRTDNI